MSQYYFIKKADEQQTKDQVALMQLLQKAVPAIKINYALIVTVPDDLDSLMRFMEGVPMASPAALAVPASAATAVEKPGKKIRRAAPMGKCSQCENIRPLTKTGICKPCAMRNAKALKKNGKAIPLDQVGSMEKKINASTRTEEHFIRRPGAIKARKLG